MKENPRVLELDASLVERIELGTVEDVHILAMMLSRASDWGVAADKDVRRQKARDRNQNSRWSQ